MQLVAELIQVPDGLQVLQELIVDLQNPVTCGAALNSRAGQQRTQLDRAGLDGFEIAALGEKDVAQQIVQQSLGLCRISGLYLGDQLLLLIVGIGTLRGCAGSLVHLDRFADAGLLVQDLLIRQKLLFSV